MKKLLIVFLGGLLLAGCSSSDRGELIGVQDRKEWFPADPYGMVYLPMGSFQMGANDQDVPYSMVNSTKTVSIAPFYMDQTEITNNEYRQFVNWVRDSIARVMLADNVVLGYEWIEEDDNGEFLDEPVLNWENKIDWDSDDEDFRFAIEELYYPAEERYYNRKEVDTRKLLYKYFWINKRKAASMRNRYNHETESYEGGIASRADFIEEKVVPIFPDTLVWVRDYAYSFNEPMHDKYFWHPAYDEYPVVGVTWHQARAFVNWRSRYRDSYLESEKRPYEQEFRLPTEAEWEYAARGGLENNPYPWGGPYIRNSRGCFLGNYKPLRGNYVADGGFQPVKTTSYWPNNYGLYCMSGNVSEWTSSAYDPSTYQFMHDMNTDFQYNAQDSDPIVLKRKVVRGGSWKDIGYYLMVATRDYEYQDSAKSFIGFRCVQSFMGRDKSDFN